MNKPVPPSPELHKPHFYEEDTISVMDIILTLARQLKVIIITPTIFCMIAIINVMFFAKPVYVSTSKIMSSGGSGNISQAAGIAAQFGINIPTGQSETKWVYPEIIKSRTLAKSVLKRKFDTNEFGLQKTLLQVLTHGNQLPKIGSDTLAIIAADKLLKMIDISESMQTSILTLNVNASEPMLAYAINQAMIEELQAHQQRYNKAKTSKAREFIEDRISNTEKDLQNAENNLKKFMDRNRRIENSPALQLEQQRLTREVTVLIGVFTTLKQQLETTKIEEVKELDYVIVLDPPETPLERSKPQKKRTVILAGILGIGLGIVLALGRETIAKSDENNKLKIEQAKSLIIKNILDFFPRWKR